MHVPHKNGASTLAPTDEGHFLMSCPSAASPYRHYIHKTLFPCRSEQAPSTYIDGSLRMSRGCRRGRQCVSVLPMQRCIVMRPSHADADLLCKMVWFCSAAADGIGCRVPDLVYRQENRDDRYRLRDDEICGRLFDNIHVVRIVQHLGTELGVTCYGSLLPCPQLSEELFILFLVKHRVFSYDAAARLSVA